VPEGSGGLGLASRIDQDIPEWGYKFHMNDIAATIGITQMPYLNSVLSRQMANSATYNKYLSDYFLKPDRGSWLYTILLPNERLRDQFKSHMLQAGIEVSQVHKNNAGYTVFKDCPTPTGLNGTNLFAGRMICIPVHWNLSKDDINHIIKTANKFVEQFK